MKILIRMAVVVFLILAASFFYMNRWFDGWSRQANSIATPVLLDYPVGAHINSLARNLDRLGLVSDQWMFKLWLKYFERLKTKKLQAGKYMFVGQVSPMDIVSKLVSGDIHRKISLQITIPEGFSYHQVASRLIASNIGKVPEYKKLLKDNYLLGKHNIKAPHIEGYLYPATYTFYDFMPKPIEVLETMIVEFWKRLPKDYQESAKKKNLSLHKAIIFASLIEKETALDEERSMISEVIWQRLKRRAPLGIDAALIYGIKGYRGDIRKKHLKDRSNPYNTYLRKGLPPTPIASPTIQSLLAVLSPTNKGYYYFVKKVNGAGHNFSSTLKEHRRYVNLLVKDTRR